jgi:hypothetical protein
MKRQAGSKMADVGSGRLRGAQEDIYKLDDSQWWANFNVYLWCLTWAILTKKCMILSNILEDWNFYKIRRSGTVWRLSEASLPEDGRVRPKHVVKDSGVYLVAPTTVQWK